MATRYHNLGLLADGGMADIELARDVQRDQLVAIKRIKQRHCHDPEFTRMFDDEALVWAQLKHPNIVALLDHGCDKRGPFIAMELVDGCDLVTLLHAHLNSGLPLDLALTIACNLLDALSYLHEAKSRDGQALHLVHRDVSPGNVLCARDGQVKLTDFGVVQAAVKTHETRVGDLKGKFAYMSPEQTRGQTLNATSDVFSAGVMLWEMLAGQPLFDRATDIDTAQAVREARIPALGDLRPDLPHELDALLAEMLQAKPEKRAINAQSAARSLRGLARAHGVRLGPELVRRAVESCLADQAPLLERVQGPGRRQTQLTSIPQPNTVKRGPAMGRATLASLAFAAVIVGAWHIAQPGNTPAPLTPTPISPAPAPTLPTLAKQAAAETDASTPDAPDAGANIARDPPRAPRRETPSLQRPRSANSPPTDKTPPKAQILTAKQAEVPAQAGIGWLDISSEPWAKIAVDGVAIGHNTPLRGYALPAGRHRITLHNPVFDITRSIEISIVASQHLRQRVDLMQR